MIAAWAVTGLWVLGYNSQAAYAAAEARHDTDWLEVTEGLQERLVKPQP